MLPSPHAKPGFEPAALLLGCAMTTCTAYEPLTLAATGSVSRTPVPPYSHYASVVSTVTAPQTRARCDVWIRRRPSRLNLMGRSSLEVSCGRAPRYDCIPYLTPRSHDENHVCHRRWWLRRTRARTAPGSRRSGSHRTGKTRRLPTRFPRGHRSSHHPGVAG